jgi:hypothetical protein
MWLFDIQGDILIDFTTRVVQGESLYSSAGDLQRRRLVTLGNSPGVDPAACESE